MNPTKAAVLIVLVAAAVAAAVVLLVWRGPDQELHAAPAAPLHPVSVPAAKADDAARAAPLHADAEKRLATMEAALKGMEPRLASLETAAKALRQEISGVSRDKTSRVAALEASVKALQQAMTGVSLEKSSAERQALFAAAEGYLKADEYAAAGQHAIAGEGYLTFLQHNPDHADARDVMKKARDSFLRAGYKDKAFWVHEEMMKTFPEHQSADLWEQAQLEKDAGLYDRAANHAAQAAELTTNPEERLWRRLYWAWYVQLRDGVPAGIAALQQVQQEIATSGVKNPKLHEHAAKRMQEWRQQASRR